MARLKRVHQLTGFADALYAEAVVRVAEFDILLDMTLINRADTSMTNVTVELSVMGDLKLVERPAAFTLGPRDSRTVKASSKVASTETGHIFSNAVYSPGAGAAEPVVINLLRSTWTSSTTSRPCPSRTWPSAQCGATLSGRTRWRSKPTSREW